MSSLRRIYSRSRHVQHALVFNCRSCSSAVVSPATPFYTAAIAQLEPGFADRDSWTKLHHACAAGRAFDVASLLQPRDGPPRAHMHALTAPPFELTPLHIAARYGHRNIVTFLALRGADIYHGCGVSAASPPAFSWVTPLHIALYHGQIDAFKGFHAARQVDTDFVHSTGGPSLLEAAATACACGQSPCTCHVRVPLLRLLIDAGAHVGGAHGRAALAAAERQQRGDSCKLLLAAGAPRSALLDDAVPALAHAAAEPHVGRMFAAAAAGHAT